MSNNNDELPTVIYIAGYGRSGSTLLDILIGNLEKVQGVGELVNIFDVWKRKEDSCACGKAISSCIFWSNVQEVYLSYTGSKTFEFVEGIIQKSVEKRIALLRLLLGFQSQRILKKYAQSQQTLFKAIAITSGKRFILDSSKSTRVSAGRLYALWSIAGFHIRVIHLVRDARGVIWSVMKGSNGKMERGDADTRLPLAMLRALYGWVLANFVVLLQSCFLPEGSVLRVRYEELVRNPDHELSRIGCFLNLDFSPIIKQVKSGKAFSAGHIFSGNRLRHSGVVKIEEDKEWQSKLPSIARLLYWVFGWPMYLVFCMADLRFGKRRRS